MNYFRPEKFATWNFKSDPPVPQPFEIEGRFEKFSIDPAAGEFPLVESLFPERESLKTVRDRLDDADFTIERPAFESDPDTDSPLGLWHEIDMKACRCKAARYKINDPGIDHANDESYTKSPNVDPGVFLLSCNSHRDHVAAPTAVQLATRSLLALAMRTGLPNKETRTFPSLPAYRDTHAPTDLLPSFGVVGTHRGGAAFIPRDVLFTSSPISYWLGRTRYLFNLFRDARPGRDTVLELNHLLRPCPSCRCETLVGSDVSYQDTRSHSVRRFGGVCPGCLTNWETTVEIERRTERGVVRTSRVVENRLPVQGEPVYLLDPRTRVLQPVFGVVGLVDQVSDTRDVRSFRTLVAPATASLASMGVDYDPSDSVEQSVVASGPNAEQIDLVCTTVQYLPALGIFVAVDFDLPTLKFTLANPETFGVRFRDTKSGRRKIKIQDVPAPNSPLWSMLD